MKFFTLAYDLTKKALHEFSADKCSRLGAALAFYTALSLAPLLLLVVSIAGLVFGEEAARGEIAHQIRDLIGDEGAVAIESIMAKSAKTGGGVIGTVVGLITLIVGATGVFAQLQDALNTVWNVKPGEKQNGFSAGLWTMLRERLLSFSLVCGMAFLLLVSLIFSAVLSALGGAFDAWVPDSGLLMGIVNVVLGFMLTTAMFAMIYKVLPAVRPTWSDVWVGAAITAGLFTLGKYLIGLYMGQAAVGSAFGAAGSFVVVLVWIYYSTQILLLGAEFTQVYATEYGSGLTKLPDPPATADSTKQLAAVPM